MSCRGQIKCFFPEKGYGFITPDDDKEEDVFVHLSDVSVMTTNGAYWSAFPKNHEKVAYEVDANDRSKRCAVQVRRLTNLSYPPASATYGCPGCSDFFRSKFQKVMNHVMECCPHVLEDDQNDVKEICRLGGEACQVR